MAVKDVGTDGEHYAYDRAGNFAALTGKWTESEVNMCGDFVYECPIAVLSSLQSGHYELDVAVRRHVFVRERWYTNILSSHSTLTGCLKDMADAINLTKLGIPVPSGLLTREEGVYHLAQTDSDLVTGSDYTAKSFKPQSGMEWTESVFWLNRALFLTKDGLALLVISRSSPDKPDQAIPLYAVN